MDALSREAVIGYCDIVSATSVEGWAYDPAAPDVPLVMQVLIDGSHVCWAKCHLIRDDLRRAGHVSVRAGFYVAIPADLQDDGEHVIEFRHRDGSPIALEDPVGVHQSWILPRARRARERKVESKVESSVILGYIDAVEEHGVQGWAYDPGSPEVPVALDIFIDGAFQSSIVCDLERDDLVAAGHPVFRAGFRTEVPRQYFDGRPHVLEARPRQGDRRRLKMGPGEDGSRQTFAFPAQVTVGHVDGFHAGAVRGWVFVDDRSTGTRSGGLQVLVTVQDQPIAQITARSHRPDVAAAHGCDPNCGFAFFPKPELVAGRTVELDFRVIPGGHTLVGSPLRVNFPGLEMVAAIRDLQEATDKIFAELWLLRDRVRRLAPAETHTVENYDPWARQYQKALAAAPDRLKGLLSSDGSPPPLVSIICPTYKPRLRDFKAAVHSALAQTYANWELIIVDDASLSVELTRCIAAFKRQDKRIKAVTLAKNKGISGATNAGIARAEGSYVALFDHDDLLAERAIEFMLAAALRTGAQMLYSDEDKIDDEGMFSEPNFKPDWNYRLLLSVNYVAHLLLVERAQLAKIGPFRSECDGSQDHDIILRLSEIIPDDKIAHVPEVLYHWRKTPTSTAALRKSKTYTVAAGIRAIQDHLGRKGLAGRVHAPRGITCYEIDWELAREPAVTIIIPYREHIEMTRACLEALWANTDYANYHIVLIDNWSTSDEALAFAAEMQGRDGVSMMRIEEKYNFSRLNNLAAARSSGELLLFMNNDVFVADPAWLRAMVGEMLADPRVGIVGNKLLYPSGMVQHGGVILGVGGVADHAHKGQAADDLGYVARAICAQEMSAVTAACMLCRRSAFDAVGGLDEHDLQVAFNDVDLCLKAGRAGFRVIWTPSSMAEHRESISRGDDMRPDQRVRFLHEHETMMTRWKSALYQDRFYHRAFSRQFGTFTDLGTPSVEDDIDAGHALHFHKAPETSTTPPLKLILGDEDSHSKTLRARRSKCASSNSSPRSVGA